MQINNKSEVMILQKAETCLIKLRLVSDIIREWLHKLSHLTLKEMYQP